MSPDEHQLRQRLFDWVSGRARCDAREASSALKALDVETIAIRDDDKSEPAREQLAGISNYGVAARIGEYIVYARK
jgi:signal transduction histidine kinase